ncbi:NDR1/HIN1-like protein 6 [Senna tora]|uniref:NDR1/HIN1-like protein 6 n=1 Tax=Senna tora TaxID=362788 RepID=A0A835CCB4_9FABA|nr:NDR1/HIN1-like protein 6 [Senna tora]
MSRRETNPHFSRPLRPHHHGPHRHPHDSVVPPSQSPPPPPSRQPQLTVEDQTLPDQPYRGRPPKVKIAEPTRKQRPAPAHDKPSGPKPIPPPPSLSPKPVHDKPSVPKPIPPPPSLSPTPAHDKPSHPRHHRDHGHRHGGPFRVPTQKKTRPHTWLLAVFCVIFWLVIIIGGLIVLIVYLIFRPQSPHFEVSSATLNAAYLDLGYLLNADVTVLANFTNPNKKVHVDFSSMIIYLYYGSTLIATQYVEPFSAAKAESRFANIHMVSSQVQLPMGETQRLVKQMESNGVIFEVKGVFRARSKLGSILRYSYNLYGHCSIMVTRPPGGVLIKRKCTTKR